MMIRNSSLQRISLALAAALVTAACGGGNWASPPTTATPPVPVPTPAPAPAPEPEPEPTLTLTTSCSPIPPPIARIKVVIHLKNRDFWTLDATPQVGPNVGYCRDVGFTDGRRFCPVRPEGDPMRAECEGWAVGQAENGRPGPTWTNPDGEPCTGPESLCSNSADNQYMLWVHKGGLFKACAKNGVCGEVFADKDL